MVSFKALLATAATFAAVLAQDAARIAFSSYPAVAVAGETYNITWGGGDGTPITLTLRKGNPNNLATIGILTGQYSGNSYAWTVNDSLATASDYALQITQGQDGINYSGLFSVVGGTGSSSISYSGLTTRTANGTITTEGATAARTTSGGMSMGTGTNMPRNTTFSSQSLSATGRTISTVASSTHASSTVSQSTSAPTSNVGAMMGSSAAMVVGLFGAMIFLQ